MTAPIAVRGTHQLARTVLVAFLITFAAARTLSCLMMSHRLPDIYLFLGGTHIHHLNYGIFLLAGVGGYLLFYGGPANQRHPVAAALYGVGLALTFDEFGMWVHLNQEYWPRASFDAVVVITGLLALLMLRPRWSTLRPRQLLTAAVLAVALMLFVVLLYDSLRYAHVRLTPRT